MLVSCQAASAFDALRIAILNEVNGLVTLSIPLLLALRTQSTIACRLTPNRRLTAVVFQPVKSNSKPAMRISVPGTGDCLRLAQQGLPSRRRVRQFERFHAYSLT